MWPQPDQFQKCYESVADVKNILLSEYLETDKDSISSQLSSKRNKSWTVVHGVLF